ncbi:GntR family transcriptional regulator [Camelliibacillus cellulosilyticus]|uniref:GntR family transcriptional regulator n=1 Tax=Camelliibacillus cellulosilyticus TaxID=2174486 RepID=A0ABV9GT75_9BACL
MIIQLDLESENPIYQQLVNAIIEGIATRQLAPGEPLPSVRAMASDLGINMHTVNKAYQILKNNGYLLIHRQKGVVINPQIPSANDAFMAKMRDDLNPIINEAACRGMEESQFLDFCQSLFQSLKNKRGETSG